MRYFRFLLFAALAFAAVPLRAQSSADPGDLFVNAYMAVQQGEKAEQAGNFKLALSKLRSAATVLDEIARNDPNWQPSIVEYRRSRTADSITRLQEKIARLGTGTTDAGGTPAPDQPPLPQADNAEKPLVFETPDTVIAPPPSSGGGASRGGSRKGQAGHGTDNDLFEEAAQRMKKLQGELQTAKDEAARLQGEKADLARKLDDAAKARETSEQKQQVLQKRADNAEQALLKAVADGRTDSEKLKALQADAAATKRAVRDMRIEAEADTEYRKQLDDRFKSAINKIGQLTQERDAANQNSASVPGKIEGIQKQLDQVKKEKDELATKLQTAETQLSKVTSERDDALAQVSKLQEAQKDVAKLVADNTALMAKLSEADKTIAQFKSEGEQKDNEIASLKKEVGSVREELAAARKESADYQRQMADLQTKLEDSGKQLAEARAENAAGAAEKKKMVDENAILRGIVLRQQKEEAVRAKTRKVVFGELADLEVHSKSLLKQIDFLSQPVVKLTEKERSLFKKPELQISESEISMSDASTAPGDKAAPDAAPAPAAAADVKPDNAPAPAPAPAPALEAQTPAPAPQAVEITPIAPAATPAPAPVVETSPPPAPSTPAKSKHGNAAKADAAKLAENSRKAATPAPVEQPPLPVPDSQPLISLSANPAAPTQPAEQLASAKQTTSIPSTAPTSTPAADATASTPADGSAGGGGGDKAGGGSPNVPPELRDLARDGKDQFDRGNYLDAEKIYRKMLAKAPNNLYTLSNLGVVLFRAGKLKLAEETFKKAIAVAPEDGFSHCTLGIVYYSQGKYDDAVNELTKALAIDPKNATAHNYLGITASQKGWQEAAEKELVTATTLDSVYADANFNLAVVYATQTPPNKENARKYYNRAVELGAERDAALEQLIK